MTLNAEYHHKAWCFYKSWRDDEALDLVGHLLTLSMY